MTNIKVKVGNKIVIQYLKYYKDMIMKLWRFKNEVLCR